MMKKATRDEKNENGAAAPMHLGGIGTTAGTIDIPKTAIVCADAELIGPHSIHIGDDCVLHPTARIEAITGNIVLGAGNVLEEQVVIRNDYHPSLFHHEAGRFSSKTMTIGSGNLFEVRSELHNVPELGDRNLFMLEC